MEKIEDTYVAFRKAIERLVLNNTCLCNACANISNLDLKFFIHYGTFGIQRISDDHDELVGSDINLLHRLLKNSVVEKTGIQSYALYTEAAIGQLEVEDLTKAMTLHTESYEHLGEVTVSVQDMHLVWEKKRSAVTAAFPHERTLKRFEVEIDIPRERVWDYLIQPEFRNSLIGSDRMEIANRANGRIAPGSIYQCYHGDKLVPQTILEWEPFESMIVKEVAPIYPGISGITEYRLESTETGTRLHRTLSKPIGPLIGRTLLRVMMPIFGRMIQQATEDFVSQIEKDYQAHGELLDSELLDNELLDSELSSVAEFSEEQLREVAAAGLQASAGSQKA